MAGMEGLERSDRHRGSEIAAADADVDDIGEALAAAAGPLALVHVADESCALPPDRQHVRMQGFEVGCQPRAGRAPQQRVQRSAPLALIDDCAIEHRVNARTQPCVVGRRRERRHRIGVDSLAAEIEQQAFQFAREPLEPRRIGREQMPHRHAGKSLGVGRQLVSQD